MIPWFVAPTRDEANATAADAVLWYIRRQVNLVTPPDYYDARHATHRVLGQLAAGMPPEEAMAMLREHLMVVVDDVAGSRKASGPHRGGRRHRPDPPGAGGRAGARSGVRVDDAVHGRGDALTTARWLTRGELGRGGRRRHRAPARRTGSVQRLPARPRRPCGRVRMTGAALQAAGVGAADRVVVALAEPAATLWTSAAADVAAAAAVASGPGAACGCTTR